MTRSISSCCKLQRHGLLPSRLASVTAAGPAKQAAAAAFVTGRWGGVGPWLASCTGGPARGARERCPHQRHQPRTACHGRRVCSTRLATQLPGCMNGFFQCCCSAAQARSFKQYTRPYIDKVCAACLPARPAARSIWQRRLRERTAVACTAVVEQALRLQTEEALRRRAPQQRNTKGRDFMACCGRCVQNSFVQGPLKVGSPFDALTTGWQWAVATSRGHIVRASRASQPRPDAPRRAAAMRCLVPASLPCQPKERARPGTRKKLHLQSVSED